MQDRNREAAAVFEQVLAINPLSAEAHMNLGYLRETDGRQAEAEASYRTAVELEPNHGGANFRLGRLILQRGDTEEAISRFEATLASENEHGVQAHYGLATAHAIAGNLPRAVEVAGGALRLARAEGNEQLAELIALDIARWKSRGSE
jgi:tetratricopeptide (TPR) repeat protein